MKIILESENMDMATYAVLNQYVTYGSMTTPDNGKTWIIEWMHFAPFDFPAVCVSFFPSLHLTYHWDLTFLTNFKSSKMM
jgi:hypothetical protein